MAFQLGNALRLQINTGTTESPTWVNVAGEAEVSFTNSADTIEVANKDISKYKSFLKGRLTKTVSVRIQEDPAAASGHTYADVYALWENTYSDSGLGVVEFKFNTAVVGLQTEVFEGLITSVAPTATDMSVFEYTIEIQAISAPTVAAVS